MSRCGSKCLHETPREAVADEDQVGWLGRVGRFKCMYSKTETSGGICRRSHVQRFQAKVFAVQYMSVLSGMPDASCYSTTTAAAVG
jgi:hypothetical protein